MYNQYDYDDDNELYHFGVKGMKWGVRKAADLTKRVWFGKNGYTSHVRKHIKNNKPDPRDIHLIFDRPISFSQYRDPSKGPKKHGKLYNAIHKRNLEVRERKYNNALDDYANYTSRKGYDERKANRKRTKLNNLTDWYSPKYDLSIDEWRSRDLPGSKLRSVKLTQKTQSYNSVDNNRRVRDELVGIRRDEFKRYRRSRGLK